MSSKIFFVYIKSILKKKTFHNYNFLVAKEIKCFVAVKQRRKEEVIKIAVEIKDMRILHIVDVVMINVS